MKIHGPHPTTTEIVDTWVEYLSKIEDPCIEVKARSGGNIFHIL